MVDVAFVLAVLGLVVGTALFALARHVWLVWREARRFRNSRRGRRRAWLRKRR